MNLRAFFPTDESPDAIDFAPLENPSLMVFILPLNPEVSELNKSKASTTSETELLKLLTCTADAATSFGKPARLKAFPNLSASTSCNVFK